MTKRLVILFSIAFIVIFFIINFFIFTDYIDINVDVKFGAENLSSQPEALNPESIDNMKLKIQILETEIYDLKLKVNMNEYVNNKLKEQYCAYLISTPSISNNTKYLKDCKGWEYDKE